ncbi:hypothetical protein J2W96_006078 [Variovorax guangxiensis]|jgi:hypothetical protein|nr:hypothetical protein [Variovorax guangxiensis]
MKKAPAEGPGLECRIARAATRRSHQNVKLAVIRPERGMPGA